MLTFRFCLLVCALSSVEVVGSEPRAARPSAILFSERRETLLISDALRGRVLQVSLTGTPPPIETKIGDSLVDLARVAGDRYVAIDRKLRQLICFSIDGFNNNHLRVTERDRLELDPSRITLSDVDTIACVTSRWSRAVQLVRLSEDSRSRTLRPIELDFEGQEILQLPNRRFLVADAFGGHLAIIDATKCCVEAKQTIYGHNIRGLAATSDGSEVLISHQVLSRVARSDFDDIHWGSLMQNVVSRVPIEALTLAPVEFRKSVQRIQLGDTGRGFADPTGIVALPDGFAVLSGGAGQLLVRKNRELVHRVDVGRRPTRLLLLSEDRLAVANEHDGTLSLVSMTGEVNSHTIGLSAVGAPPVSPGETAFYDASLSHDSWITCNSCHVDAHTPGLLADTFGDGSFGDAKLIPSLLGAKQSRPYGWLGNKPNLSRQITATIASTMHAKNPTSEVTSHLVDFIEGLATPPTVTQLSVDVETGRQIFNSLKCAECHAPPTFTSAAVRDVGLKDASGNRAFNPPSLRGLRYRRAFFHDARAESLSAVFKDYRHQLKNELTESDLGRLLFYLNSL